MILVSGGISGILSSCCLTHRTVRCWQEHFCGHPIASPLTTSAVRAISTTNKCRRPPPDETAANWYISVSVCFYRMSLFLFLFALSLFSRFFVDANTDYWFTCAQNTTFSINGDVYEFGWPRVSSLSFECPFSELPKTHAELHFLHHTPETLPLSPPTNDYHKRNARRRRRCLFAAHPDDYYKFNKSSNIYTLHRLWSKLSVLARFFPVSLVTLNAGDAMWPSSYFFRICSTDFPRRAKEVAGGSTEFHDTRCFFRCHHFAQITLFYAASLSFYCFPFTRI